MKCGPNLQKYLKHKGDEVPEHDYVEAVSPDTMTDEDEAPGAHRAVSKDPIRGKKPTFKRKAGQ